jgi:thiamine kinase-like enzyme
VDAADRRDQLVAELTRAGATCHLDLWADNLLGMAGGGVCVIDWDNSGSADPSQELGYVHFEFARSDPGRSHDLVAAYRIGFMRR